MRDWSISGSPVADWHGRGTGAPTGPWDTLDEAKSAFEDALPAQVSSWWQLDDGSYAPVFSDPALQWVVDLGRVTTMIGECLDGLQAALLEQDTGQSVLPVAEQGYHVVDLSYRGGDE